MKYYQLVALVPLLIAGAATTVAREVDLLPFAVTDRTFQPLAPLSGTPNKSDGVMLSLRKLFAINNLPAEALSTLAPRTSLTRLQTEVTNTKSVHAPQFAVSGMACDSAASASTWWLPRAEEQRRALHLGTVAQIACEAGLPARLLDAVVAQESGYDPWAVSSAGAMGMMQIMPGTARYLGLNNPFDPIANMRAGARYLREQLDRFGRVDLALAAYNAGPERRSLRSGRIPAIPETQHYVRTILTNWGRLIELDQADTREPDRGELAMIAVRASGYSEVELIRYDGLNASNPM